MPFLEKKYKKTFGRDAYFRPTYVGRPSCFTVVLHLVDIQTPVSQTTERAPSVVYGRFGAGLNA